MKGWADEMIRKMLIWPLGAAIVYPLILLCGLLPVAVSSAMTGLLVATLAPLTPWHRRAELNIRLAMPEIAKAERKTILKKMWWNIGRTIGEYAHGEALIRSGRVEINDNNGLVNKLAQGGFAIGAHLGNWEISAAPIIRQNIPYAAIYRPLNNPLISRILLKRLGMASDVYVKGIESARAIGDTLRKKRPLALLVDQKLREGMAVPFFDRMAMTPVSYIKVAIRHRLPIIAFRALRVKGCRFVITVHEVDINAILGGSTDAGKVNQKRVAAAINAMIEDWIREAPEQWFWPHRRWPESKGETPITES